MRRLIFSFSYVGGMDPIKKVIMHANKRRKISSFFFWVESMDHNSLIKSLRKMKVFLFEFFVTEQITYLNSNTHPRPALGGSSSVAGLGDIYLILNVNIINGALLYGLNILQFCTHY